MRAARLALAASALLAACNRPAERSVDGPETPGRKGDAMPQIDQPPGPARSFTDGPLIQPPGPLLAWLEGAASAEPRPLIRLPVVIQFADASRSALAGGVIGAGPAIEPDAIQIALDDRAMDVRLLDRVRQLCAADRVGCPAWLEGTWAGGEPRTFRVLRLVEAIPPPAPGAAPSPPLRALIEAPAAR